MTHLDAGLLALRRIELALTDLTHDVAVLRAAYEARDQRETIAKPLPWMFGLTPLCPVCRAPQPCGCGR